MKKIIYFCGIIFLAIVLTLNVFFTTHMDIDEHIKNKLNSLIYILGLIVRWAYNIFYY